MFEEVSCVPSMTSWYLWPYCASMYCVCLFIGNYPGWGRDSVCNIIIRGLDHVITLFCSRVLYIYSNISTFEWKTSQPYTYPTCRSTALLDAWESWWLGQFQSGICSSYVLKKATKWLLTCHRFLKCIPISDMYYVRWLWSLW